MITELILSTLVLSNLSYTMKTTSTLETVDCSSKTSKRFSRTSTTLAFQYPLYSLKPILKVVPVRLESIVNRTTYSAFELALRGLDTSMRETRNAHTTRTKQPERMVRQISLEPTYLLRTHSKTISLSFRPRAVINPLSESPRRDTSKSSQRTDMATPKWSQLG